MPGYKVALYLRVSTDDQTNENQRIRLEEISKVRGYEIVEVYLDQESGGKRSRPGLDRMLSDARRGRFKVVLAVKVDRIARSLQDLLEIAGSLGNSGVDLLFTDQDLDISSSQGRLMFQILGAFAEYERAMIRERTMAGLRRAKRQGKKLGRPKVHGSKVRKVRELREEGLSIRRISEEVGISKSQVSRILSVPKTSPPNPGVSDTGKFPVPKSSVSGTDEGVSS